MVGAELIEAIAPGATLRALPHICADFSMTLETGFRKESAIFPQPEMINPNTILVQS